MTDAKRYVIYGIPKDRADDMTEGRGLPIKTYQDEAEAEAYVVRNSSPDNPDRYEVREEAP